jgi:alpha-amylase
MFSNIDHSHPDVRCDLFRWVEWLGSQLMLGGLRIDAKVLSAYIEYMNNHLSLFDVPLLDSFSKTSRGIEPDMQKILDGSLAIIKPTNAVVGFSPVCPFNQTLIINSV